MTQKIRTLAISSFIFFSIFPLAAQTKRTTVFNISAKAGSSSSIFISWEFDKELEKNGRHFELFRANRPFAATFELSDSAKIAELPISTRNYEDNVKDYHEYYYAILVKTSDGEDRILLPSINATVNGIHRKTPEIKKQSISTQSASEKIYPEGTLREIPLPALDMMELNNAKPYPLKPLTIKAGEQLITNKNAEEQVILEPYAFEQDLISPEAGEDYLLFETLHSTFAKKKYSQGVEKLNEFLSVNHSEGVTKRAYFYLGECLYFSGKFQEAVMQFLKVQEIYPDLCQKWIDSSLDLISISDITN